MLKLKPGVDCSNTLIGMTAQFNTTLSDGDFATLAGSESLTNKKLGSFTMNGVVAIGSGDGTLSAFIPSTSGNVPTSNGTAWTSATSSECDDGTEIDADQIYAVMYGALKEMQRRVAQLEEQVQVLTKAAQK